MKKEDTLNKYKVKDLDTTTLEKKSEANLKKKKLALDIKSKQAYNRLSKQKAYANEDIKLEKYLFEREKWEYKVQQDMRKQALHEANVRKGWITAIIGGVTTILTILCPIFTLLIVY